MAKKNMLGLAKLDKKKIRRKGRHSKSPNKSYSKKRSRGQGKPIWQNMQMLIRVAYA